MAPIIGKAKFHNFPAYAQWHKSLTVEHAKELWKVVCPNQTELGKAFDTLYTNWNSVFNWESAQETRLQQFTKFQDYLELTDQPWDVRYVDDNGLMVISYGQCDENTKQKSNQFLIENWKQWLDYTPFTDYSATSLDELRQLASAGKEGLSGNTSLIPQNAGGDLSIAKVKTGMTLQEQALNDLQAKIKAVEDGDTDELRPIKEQMEALRLQMETLQKQKMAQLEVLKADLEAKKKDMEKQLFILESEIYSIRCFLGETVNFIKLRSGKNAPLDQPVVLYQKLRFMIEDLGKFRIMFPKEHIGSSIEKALKNSDLLLNAFAPSSKCISLIRHSETGKSIAPHEELRNCLDTYELLHGNQLAILIRNGENVYIGWTDDDKITLQRDFFLKPTKAEIVPTAEKRPGESDWSYNRRMEDEQKRMDAENKRNFMEWLSRVFLNSILNGISAAENSILPLPKFRNEMERKQHIIYSFADGALTDNRFGNFGDIVARGNATIKKGDMVLTTLSLCPEQPKNRYSAAWHNSRGRGEKNRTHDVRASDCTIYKINLVEFDKPKKMKRYQYKFSGVDGERWITTVTNADTQLTDEAKVLEYFDQITQHSFISLEKDCWWCGDDEKRPAHANFEVFTSEIINLTFLNSVVLNYVLSTGNIQSWKVTGIEVNYAYALRYIGKALEYVREREKTEAENIRLVGGASILDDPDWPVALSAWKMAKDVRNLTEYQAKRFVKAMIAGDVNFNDVTSADSNIRLLEDDPWAGW